MNEGLASEVLLIKIKVGLRAENYGMLGYLKAVNLVLTRWTVLVKI